MTDAELNALAEHFFANAVAGDHDAVEAMLAPGATLTQNGVTLTFAEVRRGMEAILAAIRFYLW